MVWQMVENVNMHLLNEKSAPPEGGADFAISVVMKRLLQGHTHGCGLATCVQCHQVNACRYTVEVQHVVVLTGWQGAQVVVDDLLTYEVVNNQ